MANPKDTTTLEEFVEAGAGVTISYANLSMEDTFFNTKIPIYNVISDYMPELIIHAVTVELSTDEYIKYKYKPKLLASYLYGNPELYFVILLLNNMCSVKEFDKQKLQLLSKSDMATLLSDIYNSEKEFLARFNDSDTN